MRVEVPKDGCGSETVLEEVEGLLAVVRPFVIDVLPKEMVERCGDGRVTFDELAVEVGEA